MTLHVLFPLNICVYWRLNTVSPTHQHVELGVVDRRKAAAGLADDRQVFARRRLPEDEATTG